MKSGMANSQLGKNGKLNNVGFPNRKEITISKETKEKAEIAKMYIQEKYQKLLEDERKKKDYWDKLVYQMKEKNLSYIEQSNIKQDIFHQEALFNREKRTKLTPKDFVPINIIGRGAFGEVRLCRWKERNDQVAIKKMKKTDMIKKNQIQHIRAERDVLAQSNIPWIVDLKCSFHDENHLYLVMEYLPGGDLMSQLMRKDILSEDEGRFYMAQSVLSVEAVHKLNYVHRDLKPDNILIDIKGHLKLSDFGLCKQYDIKPKTFNQSTRNTQNGMTESLLSMGHAEKRQNHKKNRQRIVSLVGTPDYIAPEVFGKDGYTETVDWWSLGTIQFEMLVGYPPFFAENPSATCKKVQDWKNTFVIPKEARLSMESTDLLRRLICHPSERLGCNGVDEIKAHPFFKGVDWKRIRDINAPNIPKLKHAEDTSIFDEFPEIDPWLDEEQEANKKSKKYKKNKVNDVHFIGYTYKRSLENQKMQSIANLFEEIDNTREIAAQAKRQKTVDKIEYENRSSQQDPSRKVSEKSDIRPEISRRISEKESRPEIRKDIKKTCQDDNNVFTKGNNKIADEFFNTEDVQYINPSKQEMSYTPNMQKQLKNHPLAQVKNQEKMGQEIMNAKEKNHLQQQIQVANNASKMHAMAHQNHDPNENQKRVEAILNKNNRETQLIQERSTSPKQDKQINTFKQELSNPNKKIMFNSSMLKMNYNNHTDRDIDTSKQQNEHIQNRVNKTNVINSTGALKKEPREHAFQNSNFRGGGSPINMNEKQSKIKITTGIKNGTFFNKDSSRISKSPKHNVDFSKKNVNKKLTESKNDPKKPFNMQFNEYMSKQKGMNQNFLHTGKGSANNAPSYYKMGQSSKNANNFASGN